MAPQTRRRLAARLPIGRTGLRRVIADLVLNPPVPGDQASTEVLRVFCKRTLLGNLAAKAPSQGVIDAPFTAAARRVDAA